MAIFSFSDSYLGNSTLRVIGIVLCMGFTCFDIRHAVAQQKDPVSDQERQVAERFLQVLMRRPRPGTALDRVYGFHIQNGSLDELIGSLEAAKGSDDPKAIHDAGQRTMILALIQMQRGKTALAAEAFARAEELLPEDAFCSYYLGRAQLAIGQTEQAAAAMERAIERKPARNEALPIFTELGRIYGRAGQNEKALAVWRKLEALFPGDVRVGGQIARTLAEEGNVQESLERYRELAKSSRRDEDKIAFAVQAAEMRRRLGQSQEATEDLEQILAKLRPGSWLYSDVRNRIEAGFVKSGDYDALADYYKKRLNNSKDNLELQVRLGRILVSAGRLDDAKETLERAVERAPDDANVRLALIDVLVSKGDVDVAAKQFEQLASQDPENPDYLLRWGQLLLENEKRDVVDRRDAAADVWQRLATARADDAVTLSQIADRMRSIERPDDAIKLYRQAIEVDPQSPQYREYLGEYLSGLDRKDEAIEVWESIASGERRNRDSLVRLAEVFATFKLTDRSLAAWREAAKLDLSFAQELRFAKILRDTKQFDEALGRLDAAEAIAETPDEQEQLLKDRIATYQQAGTLSDQIAASMQREPTAANLRSLALMHQAAGQLRDAAIAIQQAIRTAPQDVSVLIVAADIAERQSRYVDAAEMFKKLSSVDTRYRTNYLQRVADLQMRLGQVDDALLTCESLIDANPASPESYQFLARLAFRAAREEQAITSLRRAMNIAPRDNAPRRMLAAAFADRYRTDEAIELYWQAMQYEPKADDRIALVRQLAPLYDRKGEIDALIQRIEDRGREDDDLRTTQLMISAGHEAVRDYGAARQAIDPVLAQQPRDVSLLETMVGLCDAADEVTLAAEFQDRIVSLADTPENRFKLVQLKLDAGLIDVATALGERISLVSDPVRLGSMIRSAVARGDKATATAICREAIRRDGGLWDVKLYLAQLLLFETGEEGKKSRQEVISLCEDMRGADIASDETAPTAKPIKQRTRSTNLPANYYTSPTYWAQSGSQLSRNYRMGRYGDPRYASMSMTSSLLQPTSFGHARVIAASLQMVAIAKDESGGDLKSTLDQYLSEKHPLPEVDEINDPNVIWEHRALRSVATTLSMTTISSPTSQVDDDERELQERLNWRLAALDPMGGSSGLIGSLMKRVNAASSQNADANEPTSAEVKRVEPLSEDRLDLLVKLYEQAKAQPNSTRAPSTSPVLAYRTSPVLAYRTVLFNEFTRAGKPDRAEVYELQPPKQDASMSEIMSTISFHLKLDQIDRADALVQRLMPAVRQDTSSGASASPTSSIAGSASALVQGNESGSKFVERHRLALIDAVLANAVRIQAKSRTRSRGLSNGTMQTFTQFRPGAYTSMSIKAPLATNLLNQSVVTELVALLPSQKEEGNTAASSARKVTVPSEIIAHLEKPLADAPVYEVKTRGVLAAFAHWWADRPADCYEILIDLCKQYPDDVDLQIERARLASELGQSRVALDALDSFDPLDSQMLVRKEMAAMNLAAKLGDLERAKRAAERLFGMRMDTSTQLALSDQLQRLGMNSQAAAVLRRLRGGRARPETTEIQIANAFLASGDKDSAGEVAYTLLRRLSSGRAQTTSNQDYYRRQVVSILKTAGRLEPLIEQAKRRVKTSPASNRARSELAELYTAAGRTSDADKLWEGITEKSPNDTRQMLARAEALSKARKYKEAAIMYLDAFEKQPDLFERNYSRMTRAAQQGNYVDGMYQRLLTFKPESLPIRRLSSLIRVGGSRSFNDAKRNFISHALKNPYAQSNFSSLLTAIPESERLKIPEFRKVMIDAACSEDAFTPTSTLWRVISYSSNGTANGSLPSIVQMLADDPKAGERFAAAAEKAKRNEQQRRTAEFLIALLRVNKPDERTEAVKAMAKLLEEGESAQPSTSGAINGMLLWQAGQMLEVIDGIENRPSLLVSIFESAIREPTSGSSNIRYFASFRLVDAYVANGQPLKARRFLLDTYANTDNSQQNQYNPGYGDYQDLQTYQSIAEKLNEIGCPIDALAIYRRIISDPAKFEGVERWGRSMSLEKFRSPAAAAAKKINPNSSIAHLERISQDLGERESKGSKRSQVIELLDLPLDMLVDGDVKPGILLAIESASTTDEGRQALRKFDQALSDSESKRQADWSIPAARILVAAKIDPEQVTKHFEELMKRIPASEKVSSSKGAPGADEYRVLSALYTPAAVMVQDEREASNTSGRDLCAYLTNVAKTIQEPRLDLALSSLTGDRGDSLLRFVESIEASLEPASTPPKDQFDACMRIAKSAAVAGDISLSTRALKIALGNGPPLRQISGSSDAFAITPNRSLPTNPFGANEGDNAMVKLVRSVNGIVDLYSDATGHKLGVREPKSPAQPNIAADSVMPEIADALQAVVLPEHHGGTAFPYAKSIASSSLNSMDPFRSTGKISPESLSIALGRAAALAGQSDELIDMLRSRLENGTDVTAVASVMIHAALPAKNDAALSEALDRFENGIDSQLPSKDVKPIATPRSTSISSQTIADSQRKSETINLVLGAVWPLANETDYPPAEISSRASEMLLRALNLINSDSYTSSRNRAIATAIRTQTTAVATARNDSDGLQQILKAEIDDIDRRYATYSGDRKNEYRQRAMESLLTQLLSEGRIEQVPSLVRSLHLASKDVRRNYRSLAPATLCMEIAKLPKKQQLDLLKQIALGENNDEPIAHWGGFVRYTKPPTLVQRQTPRIREIESIPTCAPSFPFAGTLLMLADVSAELNQSNQVADLISARSKAAGDQADIAAKLVRLAAIGTEMKASEKAATDYKATLESLDATIVAVSKQLSENKPTKTDESLEFPELACFFVVRTLHAGISKKLLAPTLRDLRAYAIRGEFKVMASSIGKVTAEMGFGRAAGAKATSPLEHFSVVPLPTQYGADVESLSPLYTIRKEGWISGTSGYNVSLLMLRYPVTGSFAVSAEIRDGSWGESDLAYGGLLYQPRGHNKIATITATGNRGFIKLPVPSIKQGEVNTETLRVNDRETIAICNDVDYVTDITSASYPWLAISHFYQRTTEFRNIKITGEPIIPREINMIDPTMRGWGILATGRGMPDPLLPIGMDQDANKVAQERTEAAEKLDSNWRVNEGELRFKSPPETNAYSAPSQIQYLRPLLDGESVVYSTWWEWGKAEVHPSIGRTVVQLGKEGATPSWIMASFDLGRTNHVTADKLDPPYELLAKDNLPIDKSWNEIKMVRSGQTIKISLNNKPLVDVPVTDPPRPGVMRFEDRSARIRSMKLTGDWPSELPANLSTPSRSKSADH